MILVQAEHLSPDRFVWMNVHQALTQMVVDAQHVILLMHCVPSVQVQVYVLLVRVQSTPLVPAA